jgi:type II secretory pathway predicted ATPase ExeA
LEHLQHFGLSHDPFINEPDLRFYFESATHRDAQLRVERALRQRKGLTLLTGDGGMGKSLLARRILDTLEEEIFEATLLVMLPGAADATSILQRFARQLGTEEPAPDRAGLLGQIYEQLAIVREDGRHAVLMMDDAQIMTPEVFSEFGGLLNLEYEDRRLISMLLIGSSELDHLVQNDPGIAPRVEVRVALQPLEIENSTAYIAHRLGVAGGQIELFPPASLDALYKFGRGRPRLLNTLADNALFEAYLAGRTTIQPSDVERAAGDLGIGPDPGTTFVAPTPALPAADWTPPAAEPITAPGAGDEALFGMDQVVELDLSDEIAESDAPELEPLEAEPEVLELVLEEAELSVEDDEELAGVFAELIEE